MLFGFEFTIGAALALCMIWGILRLIIAVHDHWGAVVLRTKQTVSVVVIAPKRAIPDRRPAYVLGTLVYGGILMLVGLGIRSGIR